jgi:hypothetical protein
MFFRRLPKLERVVFNPLFRKHWSGAEEVHIIRPSALPLSVCLKLLLLHQIPERE